MTDRPLLDPNHAAKRAKLNGAGLLLLVIGAPCALIGFCFFVSVFFTSSSQFFADPNGTMDSNASHGAIGMILMMIGLPMGVIGLNLLGFANRGKIARYQAGEVAPVAEDIVSEVAPVVTQVSREMAGAIRQGLAGEDATTHQKVRHSCGALIEPGDAFCKGCGQALAGKLCPNCNSMNESDAAFCTRCGTKLA